ncbi:MAG: hypothetical protein A2445_03845 [Candidatus Jacksonbacteria bacterium RIFOXYC2_FULL_44_29]|nr:MAG: hypothetical protein UW45_C0037G0004 [Parcubacteria group bacterium GW2011_GWC2_44_22]OGY77062.1 MAG: hypothetical protein A2295_06160 [Candidatus Jacksonbacteria bacterium RIFOXYB2_FULL_44_15]OGY78241.1 MAG: hypothetical protein A2550_03590 [Candidatus Jacksonbacteria bacterium RIFOXYD2_FULL_43_21]OGY79901.1 MAG: hypothetical protein A2445_03845 [Candidatus Jacksonbacteria bacterium RIFOXYC2_FULL_44_29]HBH46022.1 hypothetical protein [Candidatus Jacksonbacteria bacterium]
MKKYFIIFFLFLFLIPAAALAFDYNPNNIISDFELKDKNAMSLSAIQSFLEAHDSVLADLTFDVNGATQTAAQIIYNSAQEHIISPKFILTKLDQEQCLIRSCSYLSDPKRLQKALDWACGFGVCTGCDLNSPQVLKYKGFAKQVDAVAGVQNDYILKVNLSYIFGTGDTFTTKDGYQITPENQATANLYTYTPYRGGPEGIGGNYLFAKLWEQYWGNQNYPDGTVLRDDDGGYWLLDGGVRRRYGTQTAFLSFHNPEDAVPVGDTVLTSYTEGAAIQFPNYSLVRDENGDIYLLVDDRKRKIEDAETFRKLGFNPEEVENVSSAQIAFYRNAVPITSSAIYPQGALFQEEGGGQIYWVQNGFKYKVATEVLAINYGGLTPMPAPAAELANYFDGGNQKVKDGKLLKSPDGLIYFVSKGALRLIPTPSDFVSLFGDNKWDTIKQVSQDVINLHAIGEPLKASAYERNSGQAAANNPAPTPPTPIVYKTLWVASEVPPVFLTTKSYSVKLTFKNKGSDSWPAGGVYAKLESFGSTAKLPDAIPVGINAIFNFSLQLTTAGKQTLVFKVYTKDGQYIAGSMYQTEVSVIAPVYQAEIVKSNLPVAVKNKWSRVNITITLKNTGREVWTRRKTGLKLLTGTNGISPFYDSSDWVSKDVAAVALQPAQTQIKPGESAVFQFTLKTKGLAKGVYPFRLSLWMSDKNELIYLNNNDFYTGEIRVDE